MCISLHMVYHYFLPGEGQAIFSHLVIKFNKTRPVHNTNEHAHKHNTKIPIKRGLLQHTRLDKLGEGLITGVESYFTKETPL